MSDLKVCPFCGRIPDIEDCGEHRWFIRCKCGIAQDKLFFQKCDAVRAWNKRKELRAKDIDVPSTDTISRQAAIDKLDPLFESLAIDKIKALPSAQTEKRTEERTETHSCDYISRQAAIDALRDEFKRIPTTAIRAMDVTGRLPSAQPEIVRCKDCKFYSPMNRETKTGICNLTMHQNFGDNWFCAGAERRTDE